MGERSRAWAAMATAVIVVGLVPVALDRDSFPLSTYPMFSSRRSTTEQVTTAVAVDAAGRTSRLSPERLAATDEVILAGATVGRAVQDGEAGELCADIAVRVAADGPATARRVEVVTERYDALRWFRGDRTAIDRTVHASCPVPGRSP